MPKRTPVSPFHRGSKHAPGSARRPHRLSVSSSAPSADVDVDVAVGAGGSHIPSSSSEGGPPSGQSPSSPPFAGGGETESSSEVFMLAHHQKLSGCGHLSSGLSSPCVASSSSSLSCSVSSSGTASPFSSSEDDASVGDAELELDTACGCQLRTDIRRASEVSNTALAELRAGLVWSRKEPLDVRLKEQALVFAVAQLVADAKDMDWEEDHQQFERQILESLQLLPVAEVAADSIGSVGLHRMVARGPLSQCEKVMREVVEHGGTGTSDKWTEIVKAAEAAGTLLLEECSAVKSPHSPRRKKRKKNERECTVQVKVQPGDWESPLEFLQRVADETGCDGVNGKDGMMNTNKVLLPACKRCCDVVLHGQKFITDVIAKLDTFSTAKENKPEKIHDAIYKLLVDNLPWCQEKHIQLTLRAAGTFREHVIVHLKAYLFLVKRAEVVADAVTGQFKEVEPHCQSWHCVNERFQTVGNKSKGGFEAFLSQVHQNQVQFDEQEEATAGVASLPSQASASPAAAAASGGSAIAISGGPRRLFSSRFVLSPQGFSSADGDGDLKPAAVGGPKRRPAKRHRHRKPSSGGAIDADAVAGGQAGESSGAPGASAAAVSEKWKLSVVTGFLKEPTVLAVVEPKEGMKFTPSELRIGGSIVQLLIGQKTRSKVASVMAVEKSCSGMFHSFDTVTDRPHAVLPAQLSTGLEVAARGLTTVFWRGPGSHVSRKMSVLHPGTRECEAVGVARAFQPVTPAVMQVLVDGIRTVMMHPSVDAKKAMEFLGESRSSPNIGWGLLDHGYVRGGGVVGAGELAQVGFQNAKFLELVPGLSDSILAVLKAMGAATEGLEDCLNLPPEERPTAERRDRSFSRLGGLLGDPLVRVAETTFFSMVGRNSRVVDELVQHLRKRAGCDSTDSDSDSDESPAAQVEVHCDGQNPSEPQFSRTSMEQKVFHHQDDPLDSCIFFTTITANRVAVSNRDWNAIAIKMFGEDCDEFTAEHARDHCHNTHHEDAGTHFHECQMKEILVACLPKEQANGCLGRFVAGKKVSRDSGAQFLRLTTTGNGDEITSVGNRSSQLPPAERLQSAFEEILVSDHILHSILWCIRAHPNKFVTWSALRAAAINLMKCFSLPESAGRELMLCQMFHTKSAGVHIAKCQSLEEQWNSHWKDQAWGKAWTQACKEQREEQDPVKGRLSSVFMNMVKVEAINNMVGGLCRSSQLTLPVESLQSFSEKFCREQMDIIDSFLDEIRAMGGRKSVCDLVKRHSRRKKGTIPGAGDFTYPQLAVLAFVNGRFHGGSLWRAAECVIVDSKKGHHGKAIGQVDVNDWDTMTARCGISEGVMVARALTLVSHKNNTHPGKVENGSCENTRKNTVLDFVVPGMTSYDLRPAPGSDPHEPVCQLWKKCWGEDKEWELVADEDVEREMMLVGR